MLSTKLKIKRHYESAQTLITVVLWHLIEYSGIKLHECSDSARIFNEGALTLRYKITQTINDTWTWTVQTISKRRPGRTNWIECDYRIAWTSCPDLWKQASYIISVLEYFITIVHVFFFVIMTVFMICSIFSWCLLKIWNHNKTLWHPQTPCNDCVYGKVCDTTTKQCVYKGKV